MEGSIAGDVLTVTEIQEGSIPSPPPREITRGIEMAKKYSDYDVIAREDLNELIELVDEALAMGYTLIGGLAIAAVAVTLSQPQVIYHQAIAR